MKVFHFILLTILILVVSGCNTQSNPNWDSYYKLPHPSTKSGSLIVDRSDKEPFTDYHVIINRKLVLNKNTQFTVAVKEGVHDIQVVIERFKYDGLNGSKKILHSSTTGWYRVKFIKDQKFKLDAVKRKFFFIEADNTEKEILINRKSE